MRFVDVQRSGARVRGSTSQCQSVHVESDVVVCNRLLSSTSVRQWHSLQSYWAAVCGRQHASRDHASRDHTSRVPVQWSRGWRTFHCQQTTVDRTSATNQFHPRTARSSTLSARLCSLFVHRNTQGHTTQENVVEHAPRVRVSVQRVRLSYSLVMTRLKQSSSTDVW